MSLKAFIRLFIVVSVILAGRSQNQTDCVNLKRDNKFPFQFIPESLKRNQTVWENVVREITNYTNYCIQKYLSKKGKRLCAEPVITITFPLISGNPRIPLQVLPRPYLATKEASFSIASQIVSALGQIWKLFVFCLMAAAISGIIIWFLVSINRSLCIVILREASLKAEFTWPNTWGEIKLRVRLRVFYGMNDCATHESESI